MTYYLYLLLVTILFSKSVHLQNDKNPCPDVFTYHSEESRPGMWYGTVVLKSENKLSGVWLRLKFDKTVQQLGNWFGQIKTEDHMEFKLADKNFKLEPNQNRPVKFFVKYDAGDTAPELAEIILNGVTICTLKIVTSAPIVDNGQPITSDYFEGANSPTRPTQSVTRPNRRTTTTFPSIIDDNEDDFFTGDLNAYKPIPQANNFEICGTVVARPRPLITHGELTNEGEFPWHAAIYHSKGITNLVYICGASLINKDYVVTAAHCVTKPRTEIPSRITSLTIFLGKHFLNDWSSKAIQNRKVSKLIIHPNFEYSSFKNDIALVKLSEPIVFSNYVRPICLWEDAIDLQYVVDRPGTVVGWGYDERGVITDKLHKATMPIVSLETCIYSYPDFFARFTSNTTFCAGYRNGTSVCNGDSGSGLVFQKTRGSNNGARIWQLRGIVSLSAALQNEAKCNTSHYVVFTDVAKFLTWIKSIINPPASGYDVSTNDNFFDKKRSIPVPFK